MRCTKVVKMEKIKLVEQHVYKPSSADYAELDRVCFLSKNLYNATLYVARQGLFNTGKFIRYNQINKEFTHSSQPDYCALPRKVSKMTQMQVDQSITSYLGLLSLYKKGELENRPGLPGYLKKDGRQVVTYSRQAISLVRKGFVRLSGTSVFIPRNRKTSRLCGLSHPGQTKTSLLKWVMNCLFRLLSTERLQRVIWV